jgi:glycine/D-amino acid oxidase-like deaminating enzyme
VSRQEFDVIIVGGGVMGCSIAYHLLDADSTLSVAVIEADPGYSRASSALSVGNARIQFSLKENIQISQYTFGVLERFAEEMTVEGEAPDVAFRREGNLFLVEEAKRIQAEEALALQQRLGAEVEWWSPAEIQERFPLFDTTALVGGTMGSADGHLDGYALLMGYRAKAISLGASFIEGEVSEISVTAGKVAGVRLAASETFASQVVVNCAGAWAAELAATAGIRLPVDPVKRQVFVVDTEVKPETPLPLVNLASGLYFRSEGDDRLLVGKSLAEDPVGFDFAWEEKRFTEQLWPELAGFVPVFDRLRVVRGWAGLYAVNTFDGNAILGEWPELGGLYLANGFSGHGLQQAPAVGRYLAEMITGSDPALDLSAFGPWRLLEGRSLAESELI